MVSRRKTLLAGCSVLGAPLAGCLDVLDDSASVLEVLVHIHNGDGGPRTFHLALETETDVLDWESVTVDEATTERVVLEPPEDAFPSALHGSVDDFADTAGVRGVDNVDDDFCLQFGFWYSHPHAEGPRINQYAGISCD